MSYLLPDVAGLVESFDLTPQLGPLVVERYTAPTLSATMGEFTLPAPTLLHIRPWTAHTASGRSLQQVPEADRGTETIEVYVKAVRLYCADGNRPPDVLRYLGSRWRIVVDNRYQPQGGAAFVIAVLVSTQEPS